MFRYIIKETSKMFLRILVVSKLWILQFRSMLNVCKKSFKRNRTKELRKQREMSRGGDKKENDIHIRMPVSCSRTVQQLRAALHQLHQRETAAVLQSPHVRPRTRRVYKGGHWVGLHRFWHGPARMYRSDREGTLGSIDSWPVKTRQTGYGRKQKRTR